MCNKIGLFLFALFIASGGMAYAQTHNTNCMRCKYSKDYIGNKPASEKGGALNECACAACSEKDRKEKIAKQAEQKRRDEAVAAKIKIEQEAKRKAFAEAQKKKQDELATEAKSGEVLINAQKSNPPETRQEKKVPVENHGFMISNLWGDFVNENGEIIERPNASSLPAVSHLFGALPIEGKGIARYLFPPATGVIHYRPVKDCNGWYLNTWDLVDHNWNPIFNDEAVHYVGHFYGDWFAIGYLPCDDYEGESTFSTDYTAFKLYNVTSKKFIEIEIDDSYHKLMLNIYGKALFQNEYYEAGEYSDRNIWGLKVNHSKYYMALDKILGGNNVWKAAIAIAVRKSSSNPNDGYNLIYYMDNDGNFKSRTIGNEEFYRATLD